MTAQTVSPKLKSVFGVAQSAANTWIDSAAVGAAEEPSTGISTGAASAINATSGMAATRSDDRRRRVLILLLEDRLLANYSLLLPQNRRRRRSIGSISADAVVPERDDL